MANANKLLLLSRTVRFWSSTSFEDFELKIESLRSELRLSLRAPGLSWLPRRMSRLEIYQFRIFGRVN